MPPNAPTVAHLLAHRAFVRSLARTLVADDARADDVAQDAWLDALRSPPPEDRGVRGWLARVVHRRAVDARRAERRAEDAAAAVARAARGRAAPSARDVVADAEVARRIVEAVMHLEEPFRTTILLRFYEDLPPREVAARLGVPVETVRSRVRRGLERLRAALADGGLGRGGGAWIAALARLAEPSSSSGQLARSAGAARTASSATAGAGLGGTLRATSLALAPLGAIAGVAVVVALAWPASGTSAATSASSLPAHPHAAAVGATPVRRPRAAPPVEAAIVPQPPPPAPAAAPLPPDDDKAFAGAWNLVVTRTGWQPEATTGTLVLARKGATWSGTLQFDVVLMKTKWDLAGVSVEKGALSFRIDSDTVDFSFSGRREGDALAGTCSWKGCGDFPWTAERQGAAPARFEPGLESDIPRGEAEKLGIDGAALDEMIRAAARDDTDALVVIKDGKLVAERTFGRKAGPIHIMSVTKAVVGLCIAKAIEDGTIASLDEPVSRWIPAFAEGDKSGILLRHLVSHTSGLQHGPNARALNEARDKIAYVSGLPLADPPGTKWSYNNEAAALLSGVFQQHPDGSVDGYAKRHILQPAGVEQFDWDRDDAGRTFTYANLAMSARDLARVGWLVANDGLNVAGRRVLSSESVKLVSTPTTPIRKDQGLLWMIGGDAKSKAGTALFHTGWLGQWLVVHPKAKLVAVRLRRFKDDAGAAKVEFEGGGFGRRVAELVK